MLVRMLSASGIAGQAVRLLGAAGARMEPAGGIAFHARGEDSSARRDHFRTLTPHP
jgi:hypothetical protein